MAQNGYYNGNHHTSPAKSVDSRTSSPEDKHFVVAAIDFGTTYSGYAFSFTRDPDSIHMMRKWEGGDPGVNNQKTPTTLLLKPNGEFHSFGFSARDYYHDLEESEAKRWYYFEKFKMTLHSSQVRFEFFNALVLISQLYVVVNCLLCGQKIPSFLPPSLSLLPPPPCQNHA